MQLTLIKRIKAVSEPVKRRYYKYRAFVWDLREVKSDWIMSRIYEDFHELSEELDQKIKEVTQLLAEADQ